MLCGSVVIACGSFLLSYIRSFSCILGNRSDFHLPLGCVFISHLAHYTKCQAYDIVEGGKQSSSLTISMVKQRQQLLILLFKMCN